MSAGGAVRSFKGQMSPSPGIQHRSKPMAYAGALRPAWTINHAASCLPPVTRLGQTRTPCGAEAMVNLRVPFRRLHGTSDKPAIAT